MLTLMQVINRMIYLEYTRSEIDEMLEEVAVGRVTTAELFQVLNLYPIGEAKRVRFEQSLPKRRSAIVVAFLQKGEDEECSSENGGTYSE